LGLRRSDSLGEVWKLWQRMRVRAVGIEGAEKRHLAGRETLITVEAIGSPEDAVQWPNAAAAGARLFARDEPGGYLSRSSLKVTHAYIT